MSSTSENASTYPLTGPWLLLGAAAGMAVAVLADDGLPGFAVFGLLAVVGLTWRRGEPPVFPFILAWQWTSITIGYWHSKVFGFFPGFYRPGDVDRTIVISIAGLLVLAAGIRLTAWGFWKWRRSTRAPDPLKTVWQIGNLKGLFVLVLILYGLDFLWVLNTKVFGGFDVLLQRVLDCRHVLLVVLWFEIFRRRQGLMYLWVSVAWAFLPRLGAYYSDFRYPLVMFLITFAATWQPWDRTWWPKSLTALAKATPVLGVLLVLLLVWQGGLKRQTRDALDEGVIGRDPVERVSRFVDGVRESAPELFRNPEPFIEAFVERVSYITFFSRVLDYVPEHEPYADGELLGMALANTTMPRFLFPEKPVLESDSVYTRRFTGIVVDEVETSISIGYMAEFYADWGVRGMFLSIFLYGCWIGLAAAVVTEWSPVPALRPGLMVVVFLVIADFEHQFIKGLAALNASVLFMLILVFFLRPWLTSFLDAAPAEQESPETRAPSVRRQPVTV